MAESQKTFMKAIPQGYSRKPKRGCREVFKFDQNRPKVAWFKNPPIWVTRTQFSPSAALPPQQKVSWESYAACLNRW